MRLFRHAWVFMFALPLSAWAVDLKTPAGHLTVRDHPRGGQPGVCASDLAAALKGSVGRDEVSQYPVLNLNGHRVLLSTASALASVDGKIVHLHVAPAETEGCLWLPQEFLTLVLPGVLGGPVELSAAPEPQAPASVRTPPAAPAKAPAEPALGVSIETAVSADTVRVTLTGPSAPSGIVAQGSHEVVITLSGGAFKGTPPAVGKGIVDGLAIEGGGKSLKATLGAGFHRLESLKLRNPDRLVLLFKGEGQRVAPPPPLEPPAAPPSASPTASPPSATAPQAPPTAPSQTAPAAPSMTGEPPRKTAAFDVVVLDPGHGGSDVGATTPGGLQEKDLTLVLAQKTASILEKEGLRVVLTRSTDIQVPLMQRTALANFNGADLFLSIHLNASPAPSAHGTETYYLSQSATDLWSTQLAAKENSAGEHESAAAPDASLNLVLWELAQTSYIVESAALAEALQREFNALLGTSNRGVRQAPFVVLEGAQMPAVLLEVAFLSNPQEGQRLADPTFQDQVATAIAKSVLAFKARHEQPPAPTPAP